MFVCLLDVLILGCCYSNLTRKIGRSEFTSTITLVFPTNRLSKYASHYTFAFHASSLNCDEESKTET